MRVKIRRKIQVKVLEDDVLILKRGEHAMLMCLPADAIRQTFIEDVAKPLFEELWPDGK